MIVRAGAVALYALLALVTADIVAGEPDYAFAGGAVAWRVAELAAGALLLLAALAAEAARSRARYTGPLAAAALAWPVAEWGSPGAGAAFSLGLLATAAWAAPLAHGALRGPDVRPLGRAGAAVVALGYVATIGVLGAAAATVYAPAAQAATRTRPARSSVFQAPASPWTSRRFAGQSRQPWAAGA